MNPVLTAVHGAIAAVLAVEVTGLAGILAAYRLEGHLERRTVRNDGWGLRTALGPERPFGVGVLPGREDDYGVHLAQWSRAGAPMPSLGRCEHGHEIIPAASLAVLLRIRPPRMVCPHGHPMATTTPAPVAGADAVPDPMHAPQKTARAAA